MAVTVLKASFSKAPPKEMLHRGYKSFEQDKFKYELKTEFRMNQLNAIVNLKRVLWTY